MFNMCIVFNTSQLGTFLAYLPRLDLECVLFSECFCWGSMGACILHPKHGAFDSMLLPWLYKSWNPSNDQKSNFLSDSIIFSQCSIDSIDSVH